MISFKGIGRFGIRRYISRLQSLEREKYNLISMIAYDMKSSLTIIGGFVLRLLNRVGAINESKQTKYLGIIKMKWVSGTPRRKAFRGRQVVE